MQRFKLSVVLIAMAPLAVASIAHADEYGPQLGVGPQVTGQVTGQVTEMDPNGPAAPPQNAAPPQENPIPPNAEGQALQSQGGGYCFGGPHPAPGGGWESSTAPHMHDYAPFDLRLFAYRDGCYYFIGDPHDFGYTGESYSYYGAHPVLDAYGGGWCFMIGPHSHWWRPWSPYFTVVGPWNYWNGPYDPFFWSYWPYYSFFYRSYYPSYYSGGRYFHSWRAAPPISHVPPTGWRGGANAANGGWHGSPGVSRANGAYGTAPGGTWRGSPGAGYRGAPAAAGGGWRASPVPGGSPMRAAPYGGGWHPAPGGWHPAPSGGGWHGGGFHGGHR
jgi:hypothetical protein